MKEFIKKFIPEFLINWYHFFLGFSGALFYGFPAKKLKVIGVTGTKGKSTVVELTSRILEEAGYKVAVISSIKFKIGKKEWKNELKMTMPGRWKIQRFLKKAQKSGCQYLILEVTSEGILQHRHRFLNFTAVVFTNLAPEHIERHGSFENYRKTKGKLFKICRKIHIVNLDDENAEYFLKFEAREKWGFSIKMSNVKSQMSNRKFNNLRIVNAKHCRTLSNGLKFQVDQIEFNLNLLGKFNIYNALSAICVGLSQGVGLETCKKALEKIRKMPGRMEIVIERPFKVIVDYAHTPDSLEKVYQTIKNLQLASHSSKLICVLGACGGGRDKWKRPVLGKIAAKYCDKVIVTNEDPYDEDPNEIINQIANPLTTIQRSLNSCYLFKILDRREAIKKALSLAETGDVVIITGKGCEPWMCVAKGKKIPWDDREIVKQEFQKILKV